MADKWLIKGREYSNCNCNYGCPCQFNAPSTHGRCEALGTTIVDEGYFNDVSLNGVRIVMLYTWPGEISQGNGQGQLIVDEKASPEQREAMGKIFRGEATKPGTTHFYVFHSTLSKVHETLFLPIDLEIDIDARKAHAKVKGVGESTGTPIKDPFSGKDTRAGIHLPDGFEYTYAEMGSGTTKVSAAINLEFKESYGQFSRIHMNQDGVIRDGKHPTH